MIGSHTLRIEHLKRNTPTEGKIAVLYRPMGENTILGRSGFSSGEQHRWKVEPKPLGVLRKTVRRRVCFFLVFF